MPRSQLQRGLLDAAAILSSAANIARRAAAAVDVAASTTGTGRHAAPPEKRCEGVYGHTSETGLRSDRMHVREQTATKGEKARSRWRDLPEPPSQRISWPSQRIEAAARLGPTPAGEGVGIHDVKHSRQTPSTVTPQAHTGDLSKGIGRNLKQPAVKGRQVDQSDIDRMQKKSALDADTREGRAPLGPVPHASSSSWIRDELQQPAEHHALSADDEPHSANQRQSPTEDVPMDSSFDSPEYDATKENLATPLRAAKVPSSRIARLLHYGSLGAGLAWGAAGSYMRGESNKDVNGKQFMSDENVRRLVDKLSTMRGAALKLGQFMSIQDSNLLPEQVEQVMLRVQNSAHYMPQWQMEQVMRQDLGADWRSQFDSFEDIPFASASIGQVHAATLSKSHRSNLAGQKVAVKVQFPGVRESIGSDLNNLRWLVSASALLPRGLFLDNTIRVMRRELDDECNYEREKEMCNRFAEMLNHSHSGFAVPRVVDDLCSTRVLTCEMMRGRPLTQAARYSQEKRDRIAQALLALSLRELFSYRLMQTDPNWTNFLYNERTDKIELIDFGATREYTKEFMDDWLSMLRAAISGDRASCIYWSEKVGYLTGEESEAMQGAHVDSMIALGEPFRSDAPRPYVFAGQTITERVRAQIPLMLRERLTPPPEPTYSLNRKLSGAFLLCARLKANVDCYELFNDVTKDYKFSKARSENVSRPSQLPRGTRAFHTAAPRPRDENRPSRLNLGGRWPRHVLSALESSRARGKDKHVQETGDQFLSLAADPKTASIAETPTQSQARGDDSSTVIDLRARATGGEIVRPSDAAESPTTAYKDSQEVKTDISVLPIVVRGIEVPRKPKPPGPEDCCMSGCARCVYDLYAEDLQDYQQDLAAARGKLIALTPPVPASQWDVALLGPRPQEVGSTGSSSDPREAKKRALDEVDAVIGQLDPSMQAFLQLERSLKEKGKHPKSNSAAAKA